MRQAGVLAAAGLIALRDSAGYSWRRTTEREVLATGSCANTGHQR